MPRYKVTLEYEGQFFAGWQAQPGQVTVQGVVEEAAQRLSGEPATFFAAGRTDKGVHATGQVAHVDFPRITSADTVRRGLNFYLKHEPVVILEAVEVDADFHARFSATFRAYRYRLINRPSPCVLERDRVWWVARPLNLEAMREACKILTGHHDFSSFRAADCQAKHPWRTVDVCTLEVNGAASEQVDIVVRARSFLHNQVRIMVGALKWVGEGRWTLQDLHKALARCDRRHGGPTAPAQGLYLTDVGYGERKEFVDLTYQNMLIIR